MMSKTAAEVYAAYADALEAQAQELIKRADEASSEQSFVDKYRNPLYGAGIGAAVGGTGAGLWSLLSGHDGVRALTDAAFGAGIGGIAGGGIGAIPHIEKHLDTLREETEAHKKMLSERALEARKRLLSGAFWSGLPLAPGLTSLWYGGKDYVTRKFEFGDAHHARQARLRDAESAAETLANDLESAQTDFETFEDLPNTKANDRVRRAEEAYEARRKALDEFDTRNPGNSQDVQARRRALETRLNAARQALNKAKSHQSDIQNRRTQKAREEWARHEGSPGFQRRSDNLNRQRGTAQSAQTRLERARARASRKWPGALFSLLGLGGTIYGGSNLYNTYTGIRDDENMVGSGGSPAGNFARSLFGVDHKE